MADFNPTIQNQNPPSFLGYSQPITQPKPNTVLGTLFKGIGEVTELAAKGADYLVKEGITHKAYEGIDVATEDHIAKLQAVRTAAGGEPLNILKPEGDSPPQALKNLPQKLERLAQAEKVHPELNLLYKTRIHALAKALRTEYPGYREFIDKKFEDILGEKSANAHIRALTQTIEKLSEGSTKREDRWFQFFKSNMEVPDMEKKYQGLIANPTEENEREFYKHAANWKAKEGQFKMNQLEFSDTKIGKEKQELNARDTAQAYFNGRIASNLSTSIGNIVGAKTPEELADMVERIQTGQMEINDVQKLKIAQAWAANEATVKRQLLKAAMDYGWTKTLGAKEIDTMVENSMKVYKSMSDLFNDKNLGPLFSTARQMELVVGAAGLDALKDPEFGSIAAKQAAIPKLLGDQVAAQHWRHILNTMNWDKKSRGYYEKATTNILLQPNLIQGKPPTTLTNVLTGPDGKPRKDIPEAMAKDLADFPNFIINSKASDTAKINVAKAAFSEGNRNFINLYKEDHYDPATGKQRPGQMTVFRNMTHPATTKELFRLGQKDQTVWTDYVGWSENSFGVLFGKDILNLKRFQEHQGVNIRWDVDNAQLKVDFTPQPRDLRNIHRADYERAINTTVNRINGGLYNMRHILETEGADLNAYLFKLLEAMQFDFRVSATNPTSISDKIFNAIVTGAGAKKIMEEQKAKQKGDKK